MKLLVAFDFDDTIILKNSDYSVLNLLPANTTIPPEIKQLYKSTGWISYMGAIFNHLHKQGVTRPQILKCMESISLMPGIKELMQLIKQNDGDIIITSDSNSVFIDHILNHNDLKSLVDKVFTNPAYFDDHGQLFVSGYHKQDWCNLSTENLCKGSVLQNFLEEQEKNGTIYDVVAYVGDGNNDFCPSLRLTPKDIVYARINYSLDKKIKDHHGEVKATVVRWSSGFDIIDSLQEILK